MAYLPALQPVQIQQPDIPNALAAHYKLQEMQQAQTSRNALIQNGAGLLSDDPTARKNALMSYGQVDPAGAMDWKVKFGQMDKAEQDAFAKRAAVGGQLAGSALSVPDEQIVDVTLNQVIPQAKALGIPTDDVLQAATVAKQTGNTAPLRQLLTVKRNGSLTVAQQLQQQNNDWTQNHTTQRDKINDDFKRQEINISQQNANTNAQKAVAPPIDANPELDPTSQDILSQTGLSMNGFMYLTGQASKLGRDAATRNAAAAEAKAFAKRSGTDVSTLASQYKAYNDTLHANVLRNNQMQILDGELTGTISNLKPVADAAAMGGLKVANVAKLFAGEQFTDPTVQQYGFYLKQLQSEVAGYLAAARGNLSENGSIKTDDSDMRDAADIIKNGLNSRQADGLQQAIQSTQEKAKGVLSTAIHSANKQVWGLFGLADNYDKTHPVPGASKQAQSGGGNVTFHYDAQGNRVQ